MKQVAIFMSDFHLGQRNRTEDFVADEEFAELLGRLSLEHTDNKVDLVLLGDVIDLWTTVTDDKEMCADQIYDKGLYLPAHKIAEDIKDARDQEIEKVKAIVKSHPLFFESLGRFLISEPRKRRIVYVYGNHDHSLVHPDLQRELKHKILSKAILELAKKCTGMEKTELETYIEFKAYYQEENLQVYAEHGNQLTYGGIFRYDNKEGKSTFGKFGYECPGYVHFKTVTSRVIRATPKLNGLLMGAFNPANWPNLVIWLLFRGYFRALIYMQRFQIQFENSMNARVMWARKSIPGPWKTLFYMLKARLRSFSKDEFGDLIPKLFGTDTDPLSLPLRGRKLDPGSIKTLILGHSHSTKDVNVPGLEGVKYYNTGSWALRQEKNREIIEQTWVVVSTELPVTITSIQKSGNGTSLTVNDEFCNTREIKLRDPDLPETLKPNQSIVVEVDAQGYALRIIRDDPTSPRIIDRQLVRRRVERAKITNHPVTPDGSRLNPVLRSMNLQVGDMILFRQNYGAYVWRLARSCSFIKLFAAIPSVIIGLINRMGTSTYWNHIAMVYGSPSEPRESEYYNDPLIIESIPGTGVGIHTPEHYLQYPKEWDFAVLRLTAPLLESWRARRLLRRITLNYLGAAYDKESVARGTIQYAAFATNAKRRSALGGIVMGACLGSVIISFSAASWIGHWLYRTWPARKLNWLEATQCLTNLECLINHLNQWIRLPEEITSLMPSVAEKLVQWGLPIFILAITTVLLGYLLWQLGRLFAIMWVRLTVLVGVALGICIVPIMADTTEGWAQMSTARRWAFATIWFLPLVLLLAPSDWVRATLRGTIAKTWNEYFIIKLMLIVASGLIIVLLAGVMNPLVARLITWVAARWCDLKELIHKLYIALQWPIPTPSRCGSYPLHKQFICSGLLQDALVETVRELPVPPPTDRLRDVIAESLEMPKGGKETVPIPQQVMAKQGSKPNRLQAEAHCMVGDTVSTSVALEPEEIKLGTATHHSGNAPIETGRDPSTDRKRESWLKDVIVNPDWKEEWSQAEQSCVLRDTLPRHFALEHKKFEWTYLYLDQVLTTKPSNSSRAQAYTDPLNTSRGEPPAPSLWAIRCGFAGLTLLWIAVNQSYLPRLFADIPEPLLFGSAMILGMVAIYKARQARRDLACNPNKRGRALTIGGFISGAFALLLGVGGLEWLVDPDFLPFMMKVGIFLVGTALLAGFLLLF
jgi:UDP-2,3-diacylglucosamine pyrophosphatase LpxH